MTPLRLLIWNEFRHENKPGRPREIYPDGIHAVLAAALTERGFDVSTATLDEPEHGLTEDTLAGTDVLLWWGHMAHDEVDDDIVARVCRHVRDRGMGFLPLHSAHFSKPFKQLMGTTCDLKWRESGDAETLWVTAPNHPITQGIDDHISLEEVEMYGEHFDIPEPDETIFISAFSSGEAFRSGCCWTRGRGRIFYFRPGHETYPIYHHEKVRHVIANGCLWCGRREGEIEPTAAQQYGHFSPISH